MLRGDLNVLGIGSMPFTDINFSLSTIFENYKDYPYWPQLPNINNYENMYIQYAEGMPAIKIDIQKASIFVSRKELDNSKREEFYNNIIENNIDYFKISETFSKGIYELYKYIENNQITYEMLKGHVTGPVSFGLTVTDENKRSIIYDDELRDMVVSLINMKAKWQEKFFNEKMIIFFDEPYMVSYGSAFFNLPEEIIIDMFNRAFEGLNGYSGIHCCGNTDWSLILKTNVQIINFDAYQYMDNFLLYSEELKDFLEKGGFLAWGLVPTNEDINKISVEQLEAIFKKAIESLTLAGVEKELIFKQSFITPSCGTGSMKIEDAIKVFSTNKLLSEHLKEKYI